MDSTLNKESKSDIRKPVQVASYMWTRIPSNTSIGWTDKLPSLWLMSFVLTLIVMSSVMTATSLCNRRLLVKSTIKYPTQDNSRFVYYHKIIGPGEKSGKLEHYKKYLSHIASTHPNLIFNIVFLTNDWEVELINPFLLSAYESFILHMSIEQKQREQLALFSSSKKLKEFCKAHKNIRISVTSISKHFDETVFKGEWATMPKEIIDFYIRVVSVLRHGGTAMDLDKYNDVFVKAETSAKVGDVLALHNGRNKSDTILQQLPAMLSRKKRHIHKVSEKEQLNTELNYNFTDVMPKTFDVYENTDSASSLKEPSNSTDNISVVMYIQPFELGSKVQNKLVIVRDGSFISANYGYHPFLNRIINKLDFYRKYKEPQDIIQDTLFNCVGFASLFSFCRDVTLI